jgi:hypothetical protein
MIKSWYYNQYPDVRNSKIPPIAHWINYGRREGRFFAPPIWFLIYTYKLRKSILDGTNVMLKYDFGADKNSLKSLTRNVYSIKISRSNHRRNRKFLRRYIKLISKQESIEIYFKVAKDKKSEITSRIKRGKVYIYIPKNYKIQQYEFEFIQHVLNTNLKCMSTYDRKLLPINFDKSQFDKLDNLSKFKTYIEKTA